MIMNLEMNGKFFLGFYVLYPFFLEGELQYEFSTFWNDEKIRLSLL